MSAIFHDDISSQDYIGSTGHKDFIAGTDDGDMIHATHQFVTIIGGAGDDTIYNQYSFNSGGNESVNGVGYIHFTSVDGGAGNDIIQVYGNYSIADGGEGDDRIIVRAASAGTVTGGAGNDTFFLKPAWYEARRNGTYEMLKPNYTITDLTAGDVIAFDASLYDISYLAASRQGDDLILSAKDDVITLTLSGITSIDEIKNIQVDNKTSYQDYQRTGFAPHTTLGELLSASPNTSGVPAEEQDDETFGLPNGVSYNKTTGIVKIGTKYAGGSTFDTRNYDVLSSAKEINASAFRKALTIYGSENAEVIRVGKGAADIWGIGGNDTIYAGNKGGSTIHYADGNSNVIIENYGEKDVIAIESDDSTLSKSRLAVADAQVKGSDVIITVSLNGSTYSTITLKDTAAKKVTFQVRANIRSSEYIVNFENKNKWNIELNDLVDTLDMSKFLNGKLTDITVGSRGTSIIGNSKANIISFKSSGSYDMVDGGAGNDTIGSMTSPVWADTIVGGTGNDYVYGEGGKIYGGKGHDSLYGRGEIYGEAGNDWLYVYSRDSIIGGLLDGGTGNDHLYGQWGSDTIYGGAGRDFINGDVGSDYLDGGAGNDTIYGDTDNAIYAGGADTLIGGAGHDILDGGSGNDYVNGGTGNDTLTGGDGRDTFYYLNGDGKDIITDYTALIDTIKFGDNTSISGAAIDGDDVTLTIGKGSILLKGAAGKKITIEDSTGTHTEQYGESRGEEDERGVLLAAGIYENGEKLTITDEAEIETFNLNRYPDASPNVDASAVTHKLDIRTSTASDNYIIAGSGGGSLRGGNNVTMYGGAGEDAFRIYRDSFICNYTPDQDIIIVPQSTLGRYTPSVIGNDVIFTNSGYTTTIKDGAGKTITFELYRQGYYSEGGAVYEGLDYWGSTTRVYGIESSAVSLAAGVHSGKNRLTLTDDMTDSDFILSDYSSTSATLDAALVTHSLSIEGDGRSNALFAGSGGGTISGGIGNESDTIHGGAGSDVFVWDKDRGSDVIYDFTYSDKIYCTSTIDSSDRDGYDLLLTSGSATLTIKGAADNQIEIYNGATTSNKIYALPVRASDDGEKVTLTDDTDPHFPRSSFTLSNYYSASPDIDASATSKSQYITGDDRANLIRAGSGGGQIDGGAGDDTIYCGVGADTIRWDGYTISGNDVIYDFNPDQDVISCYRDDLTYRVDGNDAWLLGNGAYRTIKDAANMTITVRNGSTTKTYGGSES